MFTSILLCLECAEAVGSVELCRSRFGRFIRTRGVPVTPKSLFCDRCYHPRFIVTRNGRTPNLHIYRAVVPKHGVPIWRLYATRRPSQMRCEGWGWYDLGVRSGGNVHNSLVLTSKEQEYTREGDVVSEAIAMTLRDFAVCEYDLPTRITGRVYFSYNPEYWSQGE